MLKIGFPIILFLIVSKAYSQQDYFVLIQADNDQPFYTRLDDKIVNSSSSGHLILPQLKDNTYKIAIGFPKNAFREERFSMVINKKDQDFELRNLGEKGWALYNRQTQEWILPIKEATDSSKVRIEGIRKDDAFSQLMAGLVNDSSVLYNTFVPVEQPKDSLKNGLQKNIPMKSDSALVVVENPAQPPAQKQVPGSNPKKKKNGNLQGGEIFPSVQKLKEQSLNSALELIYIDKSKQGGADTVILFIPLENQLIPATPTDSIRNSGTGNEKNKQKDTGKLIKINMVTENPKAQASGGKKSPKKIALINSDCKNLASENDVDRLRVRILGEKKKEEKIALAQKTFKSKCFSTKQIKILCELFPNDELKYSFFSAAYPFVTDTDNFKQLAQLLSEEYYLNRFKELTGQ
jgi:Domain of unknown function (DUF4476)